MSRDSLWSLYLTPEQKIRVVRGLRRRTRTMCVRCREMRRAPRNRVVHTPRRTLAQRCRWAACRVAPCWKRVIIPIGTETREGERNERHPRRGRHRRGATARRRPDGLYLFMLEDYPYMMTSAQVAEFTCATSQEVRRLLARGELQGLPRRQEVARTEARPAELPV